VTFLPLDLGNLENIRTFATHFSNSNYPPISHLVLNAVLQFTDKEIHKTSDRFETTFGVAHIGHALLFHLLFPVFAPEARVPGHFERNPRSRAENRTLGREIHIR
jgi:NAD(P)-dependent dehydrogenase (short-subunit alcohol dehydrogenase family)